MRLKKMSMETFGLIVSLVIAGQVIPQSTMFLDYDQGYNKALNEKRPLVVFVGSASPREVDGVVVAVAKVLSDYPTNCVVVCVPHPGKFMVWKATLPVIATDGDIVKAVRPSAAPFDKSNKRMYARPDGQDDDAAGLWLDWMERPEGMVRYRPARFTQSIGITTDLNTGIRVHEILRVDRSGLESHWRVPGGMDSVSGWRSDLWKYEPSPARIDVGTIFVRNSLGYMQLNRGYRRAYADGTWFVDVLSNDGVIFEVRIAEKDNGRWSRYVAYKNRPARSEAYSGLSVKCAACHDQAGSGGYAVGLVPGGDTIISDPFVGLE